MDKFNLVVTIIIIVVLLLTAWAGIKTWTLGSDEDDFKIICIQGHEYYRANWSVKAMLAIRLDDNGKPIKCLG